MQKNDLTKIPHAFMIKTFNKESRKEMYINVKKVRQQLIFTLNGEMLEVFPLRSGISQGCPFSPFLFKIILEVLTEAIRQEKKIKGIQIRKKEEKCLCLQMT